MKDTWGKIFRPMTHKVNREQRILRNKRTSRVKMWKLDTKMNCERQKMHTEFDEETFWKTN